MRDVVEQQPGICRRVVTSLKSVDAERVARELYPAIPKRVVLNEKP